VSSIAVLTNVGVGRVVEDSLRVAGYDVSAVRDVDPRMDDIDILQWAVRVRRLVITMDNDFGELVYHSGQSHAGVLLLRLEGATGDVKARVVLKIFAQHASRLSGRFSVYQDGRLRIR